MLYSSPALIKFKRPARYTLQCGNGILNQLDPRFAGRQDSDSVVQGFAFAKFVIVLHRLSLDRHFDGGFFDLVFGEFAPILFFHHSLGDLFGNKRLWSDDGKFLGDIFLFQWLEGGRDIHALVLWKGTRRDCGGDVGRW